MHPKMSQTLALHHEKEVAQPVVAGDDQVQAESGTT